MPEQLTQRDYLGDGVYAGHDDADRIVLTTEDGVSVSNTIVLEFETYLALMRYASRVWPGAER